MENKKIYGNATVTPINIKKLGTGGENVDLSDYYTKTEVNNVTGDTNNLITNNKSNLVAAINEIATLPGGSGGSGSDGVSATHRWEGTVLHITSASGTSSADLKGEKGDKGGDGDDGYSPVAKVEQTSGGAVITVEDANGTTSATVTNGEDGYTPQRGTDYWTEDDIAAMKNYIDSSINNTGGGNTGGGQSVYDKIITTQSEFDELISSDTWLGYKVIGLACDVEITSPVVIPEMVRTFEGAGGTRIISVPLTNENYTTAYYLSTTGNVAVNNIDFNFNLDEELTGGIIQLYGVKGIQHIKNCRAILYENVKQKSFGFLNAFSECRNMFECNAYQDGEIKNAFVVRCSHCFWLYGCRVSGRNGSFSTCKDMYGCVAENGSTFDGCENVFGVNYKDVQISMYMSGCKNISGITLINTLADASVYEYDGILCSCTGVSNVRLSSNAKDSEGNYITVAGIVDCSYVSNVRLTRTTFSGANTKVDSESCDYVAEEA